MYGVLVSTCMDTLSLFLGFILECRINKCIAYNILACIGSKIDYIIESRYLSTNSNQEILADGKGVRLLHLSDHISFSILSNSLSTVPSSTCLCCVPPCFAR